MAAALTIAIPTYNRAAKLDAQLSWLRGAMTGCEHLCDVIVSDNASTDATPSVLRQWQDVLGGVLRTRRNERNIGPLGNIAACIRAATGRHVWVVGDDDRIRPETLGIILGHVRAERNLAGIALNFSSVGLTTFGDAYPWQAEQTVPGWWYVQWALHKRYFGLAFTTSQVYRTDLARAAIDGWPTGMSNYDYQLYITAAVAAGGNVHVTRDPLVTYVTGDNIYEKDVSAAMRVTADTSAVMVRLMALGYPPAICRRVVRRHARRFVKPGFLARAARRPWLIPVVAGRYLAAFSRSHLSTAAQTMPEVPLHDRVPIPPYVASQFDTPRAADYESSADAFAD